jgi:acyl-CoA thioester hydrolase
MSQYRHSLTVRYGECDMQRIVFNANYMVYVDDAVDTWMRGAFAEDLAMTADPTNLHSIGFDFVLKRTTITWNAPLRFAETVDLDCSVSRWGRTSFDVDVVGAVAGEERFVCNVVYVSIDPVTQLPVPVPDRVRTVLGDSPSS